MSDRKKMLAEIAEFLASLPPSPWDKYTNDQLFARGPRSNMRPSDDSMLRAEREDANRDGRSVIHWE